MITNPILEEIWAIKDRLAAQARHPRLVSA